MRKYAALDVSMEQTAISGARQGPNAISTRSRFARSSILTRSTMSAHPGARDL